MPTDFTTIKFDKATHTYACDGKVLTGVTKFISRYKPPFDSDYWSKRKASERGVDPSVILKEWDDNRKASLARGDSYIVHLGSEGQPMVHQALDLRDRLADLLAAR